MVNHAELHTLQLDILHLSLQDVLYLQWRVASKVSADCAHVTLHRFATPGFCAVATVRCASSSGFLASTFVPRKRDW